MFFDNMPVRQSPVRNLPPWSYALVLVAVPVSLSAIATHLPCPSQVELGVHVTMTVSCTACSHTPLFSQLYWLKNGSHAEHQGPTWITYTPNGTRLSRQLYLGPDFTLTQNLTCRLADGEHVQEKSIILADFWC
ncbi:TPA_asm: MC053L [Molluscum contagiosum virus]|nr:MC053 [Molluscum contagiosum virus subtype 1]DBA37849.1 TPA_asm: MC053L [Molluscum contagiosum virus]DBA38028.1 TPA_asm: MC053L [Molluscum contagiosum virus]DBA38207.1 TPA_asm: MC053L [Molluscum contagiosum virus]DBA39106.1 TPA_asm: MC053L [Molluscum contagiosum virus]